MQVVKGYSPMRTGFAYMPFALGIVVAAGWFGPVLWLARPSAPGAGHHRLSGDRGEVAGRSGAGRGDRRYATGLVVAGGLYLVALAAGALTTTTRQEHATIDS